MSLKNSFIVIAFAAALATILMPGFASIDAVAKDDGQQFKAKFNAEFWIGSGSGDPFNLSISEKGEGIATEFGPFKYQGYAIQDFSLVPQRCNSGMGHTAVNGTAVFSFNDGDMLLSRDSGTACLDFADTNVTRIIIHEEWDVLPGGTGRYKNATGKFTRTLSSYLDKPHPGPFLLETTFTGTIKLDFEDYAENNENTQHPTGDDLSAAG